MEYSIIFDHTGLYDLLGFHYYTFPPSGEYRVVKAGLVEDVGTPRYSLQCAYAYRHRSSIGYGVTFYRSWLGERYSLRRNGRLFTFIKVMKDDPLVIQELETWELISTSILQDITQKLERVIVR